MHAEIRTLIAGHIRLRAVMSGARMAAPQLALYQGHGAVSAGTLVALFVLTQVFLLISVGRFADRHGLKQRVGLTVGVALIALPRHTRRRAEAPTELKRMFSWLSIALTASIFIGPSAAGLVIDRAGFGMLAAGLDAAAPGARTSISKSPHPPDGRSYRTCYTMPACVACCS